MREHWTKGGDSCSDAKVLFLYPDTGTTIHFPPHAYLCLGATLKRAGFQVTILDQRVESVFFHLLEEYLTGSLPLFIGISAMTGAQIASGLSIAHYIKARQPGIPIVWGGVHPTLLPQQTMCNENVDIVVKNEGEETCLELARALQDGRPLDSIRGILYQEDGIIRETRNRAFIDLDAYPSPAWDLVDVAKYIVADNKYKRRLDLYTSRGCPFNCSFCYNTVFNKRQWRGRSSQSVLHEISWLVSNYQIEHLWFGDDNFMADRDRVMEICEGIIHSNMSLTLTGSARPEYIYSDRELMETLRKAGFRTIYMGAESGSERILDLINRSNMNTYCLQAAQICKDYQITPIFSFIIGFPGESKEEIWKTLAFAKQLQSVNSDAIITDFKIYTPYPGTDLYDLAVEEGLKPPVSLEGWSEYVWGNIELPWVEDMELLRAISLISLFANYYQELQQNPEQKIVAKRLSLKFLNWLARLRWRSSCFALPLEWRFVSKLMSEGGQALPRRRNGQYE